MTPIQIELLTGAHAGRRVVLEQTPISFGRSGDCTLVIDEPRASRRHGEVVWQDDQWLLINASVNGTRVGRRTVRNKPQPLRDGDEVAVGRHLLFRVNLAAQVPAGAADSAAADAAPGKAARQPLSKRAKIGIGVGVYLLLMVLLIAFLATLKKNNTAAAPLPPPLTSADVAREIDQPPAKAQPDPRQFNTYLQSANEAFNLLNPPNVDRYTYLAYSAYRRALSYIPGEVLPNPRDRLRYDTVRQELRDKVTSLYHNGYNALKSGEYSEAYDSFNTLLHLYPAPHRTSTLVRQAEDLRLRAQDKMSRRD